MGSRRDFLETLSLLGIGSQIPAGLLKQSPAPTGNKWVDIKYQFEVANSDILNLNSGSAGNMPNMVYNALISNIQLFHSYAAYEVLNTQKEKIELIKSRLAQLISCESSEIALTRNTTESINSVVWGLPLKAGDEIIIAKSDYPNSVNAIKRRALKDGLKIKEIELDLTQDDETIAHFYRKAIGRDTKLMLLTYITHREGQILPVKEICAYAKDQGVEVLLDAAHAFGHIDHDVRDLGCDYYATSLHKWLNAPLGSGLLYVKKEKLTKLTPPNIAPPPYLWNTSEQYDHIGTHDYPRVLAIDTALDFLEQTGIEEKQQRLHSLKNYWVDKLKNQGLIETCADPARSCAVCSFVISARKKINHLPTYESQFNIHLKKTGYEDQAFFRVSTNLFMVESDLDKFIHATEVISKS